MKTIVYIVILFFGLASCQESLEERCQREVKEHTKKNCPAQVDKNTLQDSVCYEPATRTIHYYYTISGNVDNLRNLGKARQILIEQLRNTTAMKAYKEDGFNFAYTYRSKSTSKILIEERLSEEDYK